MTALRRLVPKKRLKLSFALVVILAITSACTVPPKQDDSVSISAPEGIESCTGADRAPVGWQWMTLLVLGSKSVKEAIMTVTLTSTTKGAADPRDLPHATGYPVPWCMVIVYKPEVKVRMLLEAQVPKRYQDEVFYCEVRNTLGARVYRHGTDRAGHVTCDYTT